MPVPHPARTPRRPRQRGMTLISVLVSLLIFAFGLLSLAGLYARLLSAQTGNEMTTSTQVFGNRFWALLQAHPGLVQALQAQGTSVTYTQASMGGAPAGLQPLLRDVFSSKALRLPDASVTITLGNDARGQACATTTPETTVCGVGLRIDWPAQGGGTPRRQSYSFQVGGF